MSVYDVYRVHWIRGFPQPEYVDTVASPEEASALAEADSADTGITLYQLADEQGEVVGELELSNLAARMDDFQWRKV